MRTGRSFGCAKCGVRGEPWTRCAECGAAYVDENGNAPPPRPVERIFRLRRGNHPQRDPVAFKLLTSPFEALVWVVRSIRDRRHLKDLVRSVGTAAPIGRTPEGVVRIEGDVRVLDPVLAPGGEPCAMYRVRSTGIVECDCRPDCKAEVKRIVTHRGAGRFAVVDETGAAIVDDDFFHLFDYKATDHDPFEPMALVVREGDAVTVIGPARRGESSTELTALRGYREAVPPLLFDGTSDRPLFVFAPPSPAR